MFPKSLPANERIFLVGGLLLLYFAVRIGFMLFSRNKPKNPLPLGAPRTYGLAGGGICPRCHRPVPLSLLGFKVGLGTKLMRCEFCGRWGLVGRRSLEELRAAEAAELAEAQTAHAVAGKTEAERTRALLDDTRFSDKP